MQLLESVVRQRASIHDRYRKHAAYQSMDTFLADWESAHALLGQRIKELRALRAERAREVVTGEWPPPPLGDRQRTERR